MIPQTPYEQYAQATNFVPGTNLPVHKAMRIVEPEKVVPQSYDDVFK
jgi:hypothetical protein